MKLIIDTYEVEVKARGMGSEKMNEKDIAYFLNYLSIALSTAAYYYRSNGYLSFADSFDKASYDIDKVTFKILSNK